MQSITNDEKLARRVTIHLCHKYSGLRLREIVECFNVRDTAISEASRRFARKLGANRKTRKAAPSQVIKTKSRPAELSQYYCHECGELLDKKVHFCPYCGAEQ